MHEIDLKTLIFVMHGCARNLSVDDKAASMACTEAAERLEEQRQEIESLQEVLAFVDPKNILGFARAVEPKTKKEI